MTARNGWVISALATGLSKFDAIRGILPRIAGKDHTTAQWGTSKAAASPGSTVSFRKPNVSVSDESLLLRGVAVVALLDMDGRTSGRHLARLAMLVPVTPGMAAAADVDGVREASIRVTFGQIDSVALVYTCGVVVEIVHFPRTGTFTPCGSTIWSASNPID